VVISHDLSLLKYLADRVGVMYLGTLVELGDSDAVYSAPRHPYTAGLIESIPVPDPAYERSKTAPVLGGELPSAVGAAERLQVSYPVPAGDRALRRGDPRPGRRRTACTP